MTGPLRLCSEAPGFAEDFSRLRDGARGVLADVEAAVDAIIADVQQRGDAAVAACTARFDRLDLPPGAHRLPEAALDQAAREDRAGRREREAAHLVHPHAEGRRRHQVGNVD